MKSAKLGALAATTALLLASVFSAVKVSAQADSDGLNAAQLGSQPNPHQRLIVQLLELAGQVLVLTPGKGFESVTLGSQFTHLGERWGQAHKTLRRGVFKLRQHWAYWLDNHTVAEFIGDEYITRIQVYGGSLSALRLNNNLGFQAKPADLERVLGAPDEVSELSLHYPSLGASFVFNRQEQLQRIDIYKAQASKR